MVDAQAASSALVPRDTPGIRDCDEGVTLISCWLSFFQYQSHVGLFEAISANARTRYPRSTHSQSSGMPEPSLATLNYYRTLLNKQVELKVGYLANL